MKKTSVVIAGGGFAGLSAAIPDAGSFRSGDAIRWRRGGAADSVVLITMRRRNGPPRSDSLTLRFPIGATVTESPPLEPGIYDVTMRGGVAVLACAHDDGRSVAVELEQLRPRIEAARHVDVA